MWVVGRESRKWAKGLPQCRDREGKRLCTIRLAFILPLTGSRPFFILAVRQDLGKAAQVLRAFSFRPILAAFAIAPLSDY
jgi:hypothetical protein